MKFLTQAGAMLCVCLVAAAMGYISSKVLGLSFDALEAIVSWGILAGAVILASVRLGAEPLGVLVIAIGGAIACVIYSAHVVETIMLVISMILTAIAANIVSRPFGKK